MSFQRDIGVFKGYVGKIPKYFRNFFWNAMPSVSKLLFPGQQCCEHYGPGGQSAGGLGQRTVGPCHREGVSVSGVRDLPENFSFGRWTGTGAWGSEFSEDEELMRRLGDIICQSYWFDFS